MRRLGATRCGRLGSGVTGGRRLHLKRALLPFPGALGYPQSMKKVVKKRVVVRKRIRKAGAKAPKVLTAGQHPFRDVSAL